MQLMTYIYVSGREGVNLIPSLIDLFTRQPVNMGNMIIPVHVILCFPVCLLSIHKNALGFTHYMYLQVKIFIFDICFI